MTYPEAIEYLYSLRWFGTKLGLGNTLRLAELAGNPHHRLRFIHVAGTNGKGSTCAMLESICRQAGLKTGLFTSPHLVQFGERIQVNRHLISREEIIALTEELKPLLAQFSEEEHPTFFEVVTVMALLHFERQNCDIVVWETGMGGRLDATNIVTPLASVITNIQFDHEKWLGATLAEIAAEKAGIIKPGAPVVTAVDHPEATQVIVRLAKEKGAPLTLVTTDAQSAAGRDPADRNSPSEGKVLEASRLLETIAGIKLPLAGMHQQMNAAVAIAVAKELNATGRLLLPEAAIRAGLGSVNWPGRLQMIEIGPGRKILLDGAHNVAGAEALALSMQQLLPTHPRTLVLGILQDKDWERICRLLAPLAARIILVPVHSERTMDPSGLVSACNAANPEAEVKRADSLAHALELSSNDHQVVITGSLYLVGEALELLGGTKRPGERGLNEWTAPKAAKSQAI